MYIVHNYIRMYYERGNNAGMGQVNTDGNIGGGAWRWSGRDNEKLIIYSSSSVEIYEIVVGGRNVS